MTFNPDEPKEHEKLVAPNENYEVAICVSCGGEFIKRLSNSTKKLANGIKGMRSKNCSRRCARDWRNKSPAERNIK